ncbi:hypothetical protein G9A89_019923 [Geosiphon pyriformis]|nr:hypothetical protein G9A89_019923 [Geosiphon pyriformis]
MKQDITQATPFELVYGRTATLPVEIETTYKSHKRNKKRDTITNYQTNQLNSKLETKYFYIVLKRKNNGVEKFDPKWDKSFHIEKILENGAYKLKWDNKILAKTAHDDQLKQYHQIASLFTNNIPQLGVQRILVQPDEIPRDLELIIVIKPNM